jgi:hypothetical protein
MTESEAIAAWNGVMRARPVVTLDAPKREEGWMITYARMGHVEVGWVVERTDEYDAHCHWSHDELIERPESDCRAWLIAKLTAAGFDVRTEGK